MATHSQLLTGDCKWPHPIIHHSQSNCVYVLTKNYPSLCFIEIGKVPLTKYISEVYFKIWAEDQYFLQDCICAQRRHRSAFTTAQSYQSLRMALYGYPKRLHITRTRLFKYTEKTYPPHPHPHHPSPPHPPPKKKRNQINKSDNFHVSAQK